MIRRDYFNEALALYELIAKAESLPTEEVERWRRLRDGAGRKAESAPEPGRRRRRRRGGRRRKRPSSNGDVAIERDDSEAGSDPAAG